MQIEIQKRCRKLDVITVKGSKLPLEIYTFDVGPLALRGNNFNAHPPALLAPTPVSLPHHPIHLTSAALFAASPSTAQVASSLGVAPSVFDAAIPLDEADQPILDPLTNLPPLTEADRAEEKALQHEQQVLKQHKEGTFKHHTNQIAQAINKVFEKKEKNQTQQINRPSPPPLSHSPSSPLSPGDSRSSRPKVEHGDFLPSALAGLCAQLQLGLGDDFVRTFNEASSAYIKGHWAKAKDILENKFLKAYPADKPAKVLLGIMAEYQFVKPADWKGYRKLTAK